MNGNDLLKCCEIVENCSNEIEAMFSQLDLLISKRLSKDQTAGLACKLDREKTAPWKCKSSYGWSDSAISYPLRNRRGKKPAAYLCYQVSLYGDGTKIPRKNDPEPVLHISLWDAPIDDEVYMGFPLDTRPSVEDNRLLTWDSGSEVEWFAKQWTYSLRLIRLNSSHDLQKWGLDAAIALMQGKSAAEALQGEPGPDQIWVAYPDTEHFSETGID